VLLKDNQLVAAAEEERFSRKKHDYGFPGKSLDFCVNKAGIEDRDIDYVVFYEKPFLKFERILMSYLQTYPKSLKLFREVMISWVTEKLWIKENIGDKVNIAREKILFVDHHYSHAASAFLCSPFEESAILTIDGVGEWTTQTLGVGKGNSINIFAEQRFPHSLGLLYSAFTAFLGFEVNEGEYKVMGMAPYGQPKYVDKIYKIVKLNEDGSFYLDPSYFSFYYHPERTYTKKFEKLFGQPRNPKSRFVTSQTSIYDDKNPVTQQEMEQNQYYADMASSIQKVTEEILVSMANHLHQKTKLKKLCIAGGVGLNCVGNYHILKETPFEEIYVQPASGDSGGALGAALFFYYSVLNKKRDFVFNNAYWGEEYSDSEIKKFLDDNCMKYEVAKSEDELLEKTVEGLVSGKVVGWFQGRFEWGPRALGNRSILADPRRADMKDIVNIKIKFREPYRPFAPSVLKENVSEYFDIPKGDGGYPLRFMLLTLSVQEDKRNLIPATTHIDGTGRLQAVYEDTNPLYYRLIEKFRDATGVPVVLNTSFNLRGEPIVTSLENAFNTFKNSGMDMLCMGNFIITKAEERMK